MLYHAAVRESLPIDPPASAFDVPSWVASVSHVPIDSVEYVNESERAGRRTVTYNCDGSTAKVRMSPVAGAAAWELVAECRDVIDRVVLPGVTRFIWRPNRTHG
jgi:hypothetical protein